MRPHVWQAEGCPPYPLNVQKQLEDAFQAGQKEKEITVAGKQYMVHLVPGPLKQVQKADRTKTRSVTRTPPEPTRSERCIAALQTELRLSCVSRLRRMGLILLVGASLPWVVTCAWAMSLTGGVGDERLLETYVNSVSFWSCFCQTIVATSASKLPCVYEPSWWRNVSSRITGRPPSLHSCCLE